MGMPHRSADGHGTLVGGPLMWVCHISIWAWDTGGRAPNVGMSHQQMACAKAPNVGMTCLAGLPHC